MSTFALVMAAAVSLSAGQSSQPLPEIAKGLPPTWPPPGWVGGVSLPAAAAAPQPVKQQAAEPDKWVEAFPHVRVNRGLKAVEFDGVVAWDFHDKDAPRTELELLVCLPMRDKEHESLVQSQAKGAHVHAALLMVGLEPGKPGRVDFGEGDAVRIGRIPPTGPAVSVTFTYAKDGHDVTERALNWVIDEKLEEPPPGVNINRAALPAPHSPTQGLVFAGSGVGSMRNEQGEKVSVYNADELGCLIGLCTFGSETIALTEVVSPDSGVDPPRFVANSGAIPPAATRVRVQIRPAKMATTSDKEPVSKAKTGEQVRP